MQIIKKLKPKITIIDYQISNLFSINNALQFLGFNSHISSNSQDIDNSDGIILPGVGSFPKAMENLQKLNLINTIEKFVSFNKPLLGICLGMQLLFNESEEIQTTKGLSLVEGKIFLLKKNNKIKISPHVGWNELKIVQNNNEKNYQLFRKNFIKKMISEKFYFIHSLYAKPQCESDIFSSTQYYDFEFCSSIIKKNIFACQFHPEKSGKIGLKLINNFFKSVL